MGRHSKEIPADAPGRSLAEFMRQLRLEAGLTWREIADRCFVSHTTLSQNADGRLTPSWAPVHAWFTEFYRAMDHYGIELTMPREEATRQAHELWKACRAHQKALHRIQVISAPPATLPISIQYHRDVVKAWASQHEITSRARHAAHDVIIRSIGDLLDQGLDTPPERPPMPRPKRSRPLVVQRPTIRMPGRKGPMEELKLCTPDSLYRITCVSDIVASLNDALTAAGFDVSQLFRRGRLTPRGTDEAAVRELLNDQVRDVLTGRYPPTPGIIQRVVTACAGTARDRREWEDMTTPILKDQPAQGRAMVRTRGRRGSTQGTLAMPAAYSVWSPDGRGSPSTTTK